MIGTRLIGFHAACPGAQPEGAGVQVGDAGGEFAEFAAVDGDARIKPVHGAAQIGQRAAPGGEHAALVGEGAVEVGEGGLQAAPRRRGAAGGEGNEFGRAREREGRGLRPVADAGHFFLHDIYPDDLVNKT